MTTVLFVVPNLGLGGAQKVNIELANWLAKHTEVTVQMLSLCWDQTFRTELTADVQFSSNRRRRVLFSWPDLLRTLMRRDLDVIVVSSPETIALLLLMRSLFVRPRQKVVIWEHNVAYDARINGQEKLPKRALVSLLRRLTYSKAETLVGVAPQVLESLREQRIDMPGRSIVIPNSVADNGVRWSRRGSQSAREHRILSIGSLTRQKGFDVLIEALALLPQNFSISIAGDGVELKSLTALSLELGVEDRVRFLGFTNAPRDLFRYHDVFVMPSRWEGMPLVLVEAMWSGIPIVATDCRGGISWTLGPGLNSFLVESENVPQLAGRILSTVREQNPRARERIQRAKDFAPDIIGPHWLREFSRL